MDWISEEIIENVDTLLDDVYTSNTTIHVVISRGIFGSCHHHCCVQMVLTFGFWI